MGTNIIGSDGRIRKKRAVLKHQDVVDYVVANPNASAKQVAQYFDMTERAAFRHLRKIRQVTE